MKTGEVWWMLVQLEYHKIMASSRDQEKLREYAENLYYTEHEDYIIVAISNDCVNLDSPEVEANLDWAGGGD